MISPQIVYTNKNYMLLKVHAEVVNAKMGSHETTNIFHYTFSAKSDVPPIIPKSYAGTAHSCDLNAPYILRIDYIYVISVCLCICRVHDVLGW